MGNCSKGEDRAGADELAPRNEKLMGSVATDRHSSVDTNILLNPSRDSASIMSIEDANHSTKEITASDFEILKVIGRGSFGKVYMVKKRDTQKIFAMKVL